MRQRDTNRRRVHHLAREPRTNTLAREHQRASRDRNNQSSAQKLPNDVGFLSKVLINLYLSKKDGHNIRPSLVWGGYYNSDGTLRALETLRHTSKPHDKYPSDLYLDSNLRPTDQKASRKYAIEPRTLYRKPYKSSCFKKVIAHEDISLQFLPDLILRRVDCLIHADSRPNTKIYRPQKEEIRRGLVFNTLSREDVGDSLAPEIDSTIKQEPLVFDDLDQEQIDAICLMSKNYSKYCIQNGVRIHWPAIGTYPNWDPKFLQFIDMPSGEVDLPEWHHKNGIIPPPAAEF